MDSNKKVIVAIVVVVLIVGVVIGALAISNNNSTPTPKPEPEPEPTPTVTTFKCESMELVDTCPYMEKSRQLLLDELTDGVSMQDRMFNPYDESEYQWVKLTVKLQYDNTYVHFIHNYGDPPHFHVHWADEGSEYIQGSTDLFTPCSLEPVYIVNNPGSATSFNGTVELWYLLPPLTNGVNVIIDWKDVTPSNLHISLYSKLGQILMEC